MTQDMLSLPSTISDSTVLASTCISARDEDMLGIPCLPAREAWRAACRAAV